MADKTTVKLNLLLQMNKPIAEFQSSDTIAIARWWFRCRVAHINSDSKY